MGQNTPEYQAEYRARNPEYMRRQRQRQSARTAAVKRLTERHAEEFRALFAKELERYGLQP